MVACEANERILNVFAIGPTGTFDFEENNRATFRPQTTGSHGQNGPCVCSELN
jgi:hypothetical protein